MAVKTTVENMAISDIIPCRCRVATANTPAVLSELGTCILPEIPVTGTATPDGLFYFRKADKGLLIADRVVQTGISWDVLNSAKYIQGKLIPDISQKPLISQAISANIFEDVEVTSNVGVGWKTFNSTTVMYSYPSSGVGTSVITKFTSGKILNQIILTNSSYTGDGIAGPVSSFKLYGSFNGVDYVELLSKSGIPNVIQSYSYSFDNTVAYPYYKFNVLGIYGDYAYFRLAYYDRGDLLASNGIIRSLTGGNSYLGSDGKASLTDKGLGAWPVNNEWDSYIVNSDLGGTITPGDDAVWHWGLASWVQDTAINGTINIDGYAAINSSRFVRGSNAVFNELKGIAFGPSSSSGTSYGFRPVLEYPEDPKCTNVWY
jgi:hypothetical protein